MEVEDLYHVIYRLDEDQAITDEFEGRGLDGYPGPKVPWYRSQQEHLLGWLSQLNGPGAYNRANFERTPRDFYQSFQCVAGLIWLAEALGEDPQVHVRRASAAHSARSSRGNGS